MYKCGLKRDAAREYCERLQLIQSPPLPSAQVVSYIIIIMPRVAYIAPLPPPPPLAALSSEAFFALHCRRRRVTTLLLN